MKSDREMLLKQLYLITKFNLTTNEKTISLGWRNSTLKTQSNNTYLI
jgi:hypothetical protein